MGNACTKSDVTQSSKQILEPTNPPEKIVTKDSIDIKEKITITKNRISNCSNIHEIKREEFSREPGKWVEVRLFISSTFVDTQAERDILIKHVIPDLNRKFRQKLV